MDIQLIRPIFLLICSMLCVHASHAQLTVFRDKESGLYGLLREDSTMALEPVYSEISSIRKYDADPKATYLIRTNHGTGIADSLGNIVIQPVFEALIPLPYAIGDIDFRPSHTNFIYLENGKYGVLSANGNKVTEALFNFDTKQVNGRAYAYYLTQEKAHALYVFYPSSTKPVCKKLPLLFRSDSLYVFAHHDRPLVYYTTSRETNKMHPTAQHHFSSGKYIYLQMPAQLRIFNRRGKEIGGNNLLDAWTLYPDEGPETYLAVHCRQKKMGVLNEVSCTWILDTIYSEIIPQFEKNNIWAKLPDGWALFDAAGHKKTDLLFDTWVYADTMQLSVKRKTGLLGPDMQWLIPPVYSGLTRFRNNMYLATTPGGHLGVVDQCNKILTDTLYTDFIPVFENTYEGCALNHRWPLHPEYWMLQDGPRRVLLNSHLQTLASEHPADTNGQRIDSLLYNFALAGEAFFDYGCEYDFIPDGTQNIADGAFKVFNSHEEKALYTNLPFKKELYTTLRGLYEAYFPMYSYRYEQGFTGKTMRTRSADSVLVAYGIKSAGNGFLSIFSKIVPSLTPDYNDFQQAEMRYGNYIWSNGGLHQIALKDLFGTGTLLQEEVLHLSAMRSYRLDRASAEKIIRQTGEDFSLTPEGVVLYYPEHSEAQPELFLITIERLLLHKESTWVVEYLKQ